MLLYGVFRDVLVVFIVPIRGFSLIVRLLSWLFFQTADPVAGLL